jgi:hypothetical protein
VVAIIVFSLLVSWPGISLRQRFFAFLLSLPLIFLIAIVDIPILFICSIKMILSDDTVGGQMSSFWRHFMNNGGRQFLAVIAFAVAIAPFYLKGAGALPSAVKVGRNDPCPCGSGKKYKHCCLSKTL